MLSLFHWSMYLPVCTEESLMGLHQAKRPVIVYRSISISTKLICEQQLIPIKPNKESGNGGVDGSISNAVCITYTHKHKPRSYWQCLCSFHSFFVHTLILMDKNMHKGTEKCRKRELNSDYSSKTKF